MGAKIFDFESELPEVLYWIQALLSISVLMAQNILKTVLHSRKN